MGGMKSEQWVSRAGESAGVDMSCKRACIATPQSSRDTVRQAFPAARRLTRALAASGETLPQEGLQPKRLTTYRGHHWMADFPPPYTGSKKAVEKAGQTLRAGFDDIDAWFAAFNLLQKWRASYSLPLNSAAVQLRTAAKRIHADALVGQRQKRLPSILAKLHKEPKMQLDRMQDIGGARAIVASVDQVNALAERLIASRRGKAVRLLKDYIVEPNPKTGYRSVHLLYKYKSRKPSLDGYNGTPIEFQIRTLLQHAWATTVETVDVFNDFSLKSIYSEDHPDWRAFFRLMSSLFALEEGTALVEGTPTTRGELVQQIAQMNRSLSVLNLLETYVGVTKHIYGVDSSSRAGSYLLKLDSRGKSVEVVAFAVHAEEEANAAYAKAESDSKDVPGVQVVLVRAPSIAALPKAYPNFFGDTGLFREKLRAALIEAEGMLGLVTA